MVILGLAMRITHPQNVLVRRNYAVNHPTPRFTLQVRHLWLPGLEPLEDKVDPRTSSLEVRSSVGHIHGTRFILYVFALPSIFAFLQNLSAIPSVPCVKYQSIARSSLILRHILPDHARIRFPWFLFSIGTMGTAY